MRTQRKNFHKLPMPLDSFIIRVFILYPQINNLRRAWLRQRGL